MPCQTLQHKSQDILNAMQLVNSTKLLIQKLQDEERDVLLSYVKSFCENVIILVPNMSDMYVARKRGANHQQDRPTIEHDHYKIDICLLLIDSIARVEQ